MSDPISFSFTPSADDLTLAYQRYNRVRLHSSETLTAFVATLALLAIVLSITMPYELIPIACILVMSAIGGSLVPLAMIRWRVPALARRIYAQQRDLHEALTVEADAEDLATSAEGGTSRTPWSHYTRWVEDKDVILLYRSEALFQFIPKRAITPAQVEALRGFAAAAGVQAAARRSG